MKILQKFKENININFPIDLAALDYDDNISEDQWIEISPNGEVVNSSKELLLKFTLENGDIVYPQPYFGSEFWIAETEGFKMGNDPNDYYGHGPNFNEGIENEKADFLILNWQKLVSRSLYKIQV